MQYKETTSSLEQRVEQLLDQMTLPEKLAQLGSVSSLGLLGSTIPDPDKMANVFQYGIGQISRVGGLLDIPPQETARIVNTIQDYLLNHTRLGIPALIHEECLCGYETKQATVFPQMLGAAATWNPDLIERMTLAIREQMRVVGVHQGLSPVLDVARDPRWGRTEETFGEDPYLVSAMGVAYVKGLQGDLSNGVAATAKHFIGYSLSEGGMNWAPAHIAKRELYEVFARPFEAAIHEAGLASVMNAYNELDGVPCGVSYQILTELLREHLGFTGFVVSDYYAISTAHSYHKIGSSLQDAAVLALTAGLDVELPTTLGYGDMLLDAVESGAISIDIIDTAVRRVLEAKFRLGLFENPYAQPERLTEIFTKPETAQIASEIAAQSITLLKNEGNLLPLPPTVRSIAVIGPSANSMRNLFGDYTFVGQLEGLLPLVQSGLLGEQSTISPEIIQGMRVLYKDLIEAPDEEAFTRKNYQFPTIYEAIDQTADAMVTYARGCDIRSEDTSGFESAVQAAEAADVVVMVLGEKSGLDSRATSGESRDRDNLDLPGVQQALLEAVYATGKPIVLVLVNGRPLALNWADEHIPAIIEAYVPGEKGAQAIADVLFGKVNPGGKLPISVPRSVGQIPVYHYHKPSGGRSHWTGAYVESATTPLYPFGFGLSYTTFEYSDLSISQPEVPTDGEVKIRLRVTNTGSRAGDEVVQLYLHDRHASVTRPGRALVGFKRVTLDTGESASLTFTVAAALVGLYDRAMQFVVEPGEVDVMVGSSSADIRLTGMFTLIGETAVLGKRRTFFSTVTVTRP